MNSFPRDIYIDIDGVVLTKGVVQADHLETFLRYILSRYAVSWLTTRCHGDSNPTVKYLSPFLSTTAISLVKEIKPTSFRIDKTEAINFTRDFLWLENEPFESEIVVLKNHNKYDSLVKIDLIENPNQLLDLVRSKPNRFLQA